MPAPKQPPVVTIDGPSGAGKGTVGQALARRLGWHFLDSGAVYRVLALAVERAGIDPADSAAVSRLAGGLGIEFLPAPDGPPRVLLDGKDVSEAIRSEACGDLASRLAAAGPVREALLGLQRRLRRPPGLVADGRDMGTTVFPDALVKIYLLASPEVRARRRYKQLKDKELNVSLARLILDIRERDLRDARRAVSPLKPAPDAYHLDSSDRTVDEVVADILARVRAKRSGSA